MAVRRDGSAVRFGINVTSGSVSWDDCISISSSDPFGNRVKQVVPSWDAFAVLHVNGSVSVWEKSVWTGPVHSAESSEIENAHAVYSLHSGFAVIHGDSDSLAVLKSRDVAYTPIPTTVSISKVVDVVCTKTRLHYPPSEESNDVATLVSETFMRAAVAQTSCTVLVRMVSFTYLERH